MATHYPNTSGVEFKDAFDLPGYCVGDDQSVWSRHRVGPPYGIGDRWHQLTPTTNASGHKIVTLRKNGKPKGFLIHRLILEAFVCPCPEGMECCHENGDPSDNRLENLRWDTRTANVADARRHGTDKLGSRNGQAKMSEADVESVRRRYLAGEKQKDLALEFGVSKGQMSQAITGKTWKHVGETPVPRSVLRERKKTQVVEPIGAES